MNSLTPSPGDPGVKVIGREPVRPGDSQPQTAAGTKPGALEYPFTAQARACPEDERAALHMASPLQAMVFSTFPEIPVNLSCLSCQPEQGRRLHFDSCSWKIQLPPSSSSPLRPTPTCLKKNKKKKPEEGPSYSSLPGPSTPIGRPRAAPGKGHGHFLPPKASGAAGDAPAHSTLNLKLALSPQTEMCGQVPVLNKSW